MSIEFYVAAARDQGASDLHLEGGLPPALRVRGALKTGGEPVSARFLLEMARQIVGAEQWPHFVERRSYDLSRTISGVRCRINILQTARGIGFAIRLLASFQASIEKLNLHPDLRRFATLPHGLVLLSGPTGCGKSSTMAALIQEINTTESRHILTIESPIEHTFRPRQSYIRQREVGRDTPSFEQALIDALREDPDVLMVGEMREPEVMRLTLNASETGHLVFATVHSSSCIEALQRIANAFPSDMQSAVRAQMADCLGGVVCQRLRYRPELKIRVPELEILVPTYATKAHIRSGDFSRIGSSLETGAEHGCWTWQRYQTWIENRKQWNIPDASEKADVEPASEDVVSLPPIASPVKAPREAGAQSSPRVNESSRTGRAIEIEPVEGGLSELIKKLEG
ncbi:MAG: twitching motility protein PilT [Verrucomicrobiota bacterium]|jgi:twitching motility protein PilT